jgi:hypothetical protein
LTIYDQTIRNECGYKGPLPFWDWSIDATNPDQSHIWKGFGETDCITFPGVPQLQATYPYKHCVHRSSNLKGTSFFSPIHLGLIEQKQTFDDFCKSLEVLIIKFMIVLVVIWVFHYYLQTIPSFFYIMVM